MSGNLSTAGVEETLKDFWVSRPRRPHEGRKIAGVAAGIAERYQIDPVIVRVAFVAMALCNGAGILIYLLGWLWLAQADDEVSAAESLIGRGRSSTPVALTVLLGLAVLPATGFFVDGGFTMVAGVLLSVGSIYLLHRSRGSLNRPTAAPEVNSVDTSDSPTTRVNPPAWDPLGAAPFAWDLPEPTSTVVPVAAPRPPRRRSRTGAVTFGLAMVVLAGSLVASATSPWFDVQHTIGLIVATLGLGLLVGAFRGGGRGLIGLVVPLSLVGVAMTSIDFDALGNSDHVGDVLVRPTSTEQVESRYDTKAGTIEVDLTGLPSTGSVKSELEVGVGSAQVRVPANADVVANCHTGLGEVQCLGTEANGRDRSASVTDKGADGDGGLKVELDLRAGVGEVVVIRG
ncbi:phage shock protein PspC (stress-responsive transcriptional regulator) [Saccharothrix tamanrassetensis]|uniref:Phage shock protein PspC (Stress-responsive transcriptional regulator) n=1 Tax=Saccharothrix tamanrassetensis TaxID=1051531 RepID=A0A841CFH9_9PSEU|nr:PspC domain-containing protein [Saccharothrix tamanrassetensis]MBB5954938.1 phage shock protein PspC (stress-responsive transcriptional regulator) [Saccharothrix tamanrassetensis]